MFSEVADANRGNSFLIKTVMLPRGNGEVLINDAVFAEHQPGKVTRF